MPQTKIDKMILTLLGFLLAGMIIATLPPVRAWLIPAARKWQLFVQISYFYMVLGVLNFLVGLGLWKCKDINIKELGTLIWLLEVGVAGFIFISIFFLRLDWGILPFYAGLRSPYFSWRIFLPIAIFAAGMWFLSYRERSRLGARELAILVGLSFMLNLAVLAVNPSFVTEVTRTFNRVSVEYYGDIPKVDHNFFFHYADKMPYLSLHGKTHPPLATLFLWALTQMGFGIFGASLVTTLFGSLTLIFVYYISNDLFGEEAARISVGIFWLVPAIVLYSAVSMDILFMFLCTATVFCFQRALYKIHYVMPCALFFSLALFSTFTAGFLVLLFAIWIGLSHFKESLPITAYRNLTLAGGLIVLIHLVLYWGLNYNVIEVFLNARYLNAIMMTGPRARPYSYWVVGNLVDYFTFLGFTVFSMVCLYGWSVKKKISAPDIPFVAVVCTLFIFNVSGLIRQEVARVWLPFTPLLIASMANFVGGWIRRARWVFPFMTTFLFLQTLFFEIFFDTIW
jgi:hypothetical protein